VYRLGPHQYRVETGDARIEIHRTGLGHSEYWLNCFGRRFNIVSVVQGLSFLIEVDGIAHRINRDAGGLVHAPAPAVVVSLAVKPGDTVSAGDRLAVLEAMKMEMQVVAPFAGKVRQVLTMANVQVDTGTPLVQLEPLGSDDAAVGTERLIFETSLTSEPSDDLCSRCHRSLTELRQLTLGFDVDPARTSLLLAEWNQAGKTSVENEEMRQCEDEILRIFVDLCYLFHREPDVEGPTAGEAPSSEAYLFSYLRMLETQGEGLPQDSHAETGPLPRHPNWR
jgi:pyruvate/2-oxoglutarate dehydrogenase complex dihydrolipoamide acyltransferase (E2) component